VANELTGEMTEVAEAPGGERLRELRRAAGRTQLWVETEAELGTGYLQRLEAGRVAKPGADTLTRILNALDARYSERREIMERFGYTVATPLPTADDIRWAWTEARRDLDEVALPAYVLDCTHRLIAWNRFLPHLLGVPPDHRVLDELAQGSMIVHWFYPASPLALLLAEPDGFLLEIARVMRDEMRRFWSEPWAAELIAEHMAAIPRFRAMWNAAESAPATASAARALIPLRLRVPGAGLLSFHFSSEPFSRDARFRVIYYFPADPETMRQCAVWAARHGESDG